MSCRGSYGPSFWAKNIPTKKESILETSLQNNTFREKSVCLYVCMYPSCPVSVPQKVIETENCAKQSRQIHFKGNKTTLRVILLPLCMVLGKVKPNYEETQL